MNTEIHSLAALSMMLEAVEHAISAGDWVVDGAFDPDAAIQYAKHVLESAGYERNKIDGFWMVESDA